MGQQWMGLDGRENNEKWPPNIKFQEVWKKIITTGSGVGEGIDSTWICFHREPHFALWKQIHVESFLSHLPTLQKLVFFPPVDLTGS